MRAVRDHGPRDRDFLCAMMALSLRMDEEGKAYPGLRLWAADAHMAPNTVMKHRDRAITEGWLSAAVSAKSRSTYRCCVPANITPSVLSKTDTDRYKFDDSVSPNVIQMTGLMPDEQVAAIWAEFKSVYPKRAGEQKWRLAESAAIQRIHEGHTTAQFLDGARRYAIYLQATEKLDTQFVKQAATFLGPSKSFLEPWTPPRDKGQRRQDDNIEAARAWLEGSDNAAA